MKTPFLLISFFFILLIYFPPLCFFFSIIGLFLVGSYKVEKIHVYVYLFSIFSIFSLIIAANSHPLFLWEEQDFTTYYNNYYDMLDGEFIKAFTNFGGGVEVGVPTLNYIFYLFVGEPYPYLLKMYHALIQVLLLFFIGVKVRKFYGLSMSQLSILLSFMLLFYKFGTTLNHLRQGYASFFILLCIFTENKKSKSLLFLIGRVFHVSTFLIYFLIKFLILSKDVKKLKIFSFFTISSAVIIFFLLDIVSTFILGSGSSILAKLNWAMEKSQELEAVNQSLHLAIVASIYIVFLLIIMLFLSFFYKRNSVFIYNLYAIVLFIISFSFLPAISLRSLAPILSIFIGFLYFKVLYLEFKIKFVSFFFFFFIFFFQANWLISSEIYYYRYPIFSYKPFYYLDDLLVENMAVNRHGLPKQKNILIDNSYR